MIKEILHKNEIAILNSLEIAVLHEHCPACFKKNVSVEEHNVKLENVYKVKTDVKKSERGGEQ